MTALEKMRKAFEECTVMAGVEPDFECIYITKAAANALFSEAEAENVKLRELVLAMATRLAYADRVIDGGVFDARLRREVAEVGAEVDAQ